MSTKDRLQKLTCSCTQALFVCVIDNLPFSVRSTPLLLPPPCPRRPDLLPYYTVAAIVQSGLHMTADAFAQPCPRCPRVESPAGNRSAYGSQLPAGGAQHHLQQGASRSTKGATATAVGERWGWRRHRDGRGSSSAALSSVGTSAVGAVVAAGGAAVAVEERISTQERGAISRGVTSVMTLEAIG